MSRKRKKRTGSKEQDITSKGMNVRSLKKIIDNYDPDDYGVSLDEFKGLLKHAVPLDDGTWEKAFAGKKVYVPAAAQKVINNFPSEIHYSLNRYEQYDVLMDNDRRTCVVEEVRDKGRMLWVVFADGSHLNMCNGTRDRKLKNKLTERAELKEDEGIPVFPTTGYIRF